MSQQPVKDLGTVLDTAFTFIAKAENEALYNAILSAKRYDPEGTYIPNVNTGPIPFLGEYNDLSGNRTYAFGLEVRTNKNPDGVVPAKTIPEMQLQFKERIQKDIDFVNKLEDTTGKRIVNTLDTNQKAALVSLVYNIGQGRFLNSKAFREGLAVGDMDKFKFEAFDSEQGFVKDEKGGTILDGLVNRRQAELDLFETAERQRKLETNPTVDTTKIEPEPLENDGPVEMSDIFARRAGVNIN
jgi:GH24 family phage-related lysozyme (muramidase)